MVFDTKYITKNAEETFSIGKKLGSDIVTFEVGRKSDKIPVICLFGNLGSGKTTFTQGFAEGIGLKRRILSPTFILVKKYVLSSVQKFFYHIDLFRIQSSSHLIGLGLADIFQDRSALVIVEWADRLGPLLPSSRIDIHFSVDKHGYHTLNFISINL